MIFCTGHWARNVVYYKGVLKYKRRIYMTINFKDLKKEIPYKFKPQTCKYGKATIVAYIDSRDAQDLLDDVCGPENWQDDYRVIDGKVYGGIGINVGTAEYPMWVWKWDCGVESNMEQEKGQASDAFKRAAVKWGIGRFLYRLDMIQLPTKKYKDKERPATFGGDILWGNDDLSEYIKTNIIGKKKPSTKKSNRYEKPASEPKYNKNSYSKETIKRVTELEKDGKKGKECLKIHLEGFNKENGTNITKIQEMDDKTLNSLIDYIEEIKPQGI